MTRTPPTRKGARPRVALLALEAAAPGSVAGVVRLQAELLAGTFDVTVVAGSVLKDRHLPYRSVEIATPSFVSWRRFGHAPREWWASRRLIAATLAAHRRHAFDIAILHTHTLAAVGGASLTASGIRTVLVAHADIRRGPKAYGSILTALYRWSNPRGYSRVDRVVALSSDYAAIARLDASDPAAVRVIPCPVSGPWPARPRLRTRIPGLGSPLQIGFAGRLALEKGLQNLFLAFRSLLESGLDCRLRIAGQGQAQSELMDLAEELSLAGRIDFLGWLSSNELSAFYQSLDLFCLPSLAESQGLVAQEALLNAVPVVASRLGPLMESIRPGIDGELCEPGDPEALADAVRRATSQLGGAGYRVPDPEWMERFSPASHVRAMSDLIRELVFR